MSFSSAEIVTGPYPVKSGSLVYITSADLSHLVTTVDDETTHIIIPGRVYVHLDEENRQTLASFVKKDIRINIDCRKTPDLFQRVCEFNPWINNWVWVVTNKAIKGNDSRERKVSETLADIAVGDLVKAKTKIDRRNKRINEGLLLYAIHRGYYDICHYILGTHLACVNQKHLSEAMRMQELNILELLLDKAGALFNDKNKLSIMAGFLKLGSLYAIPCLWPHLSDAGRKQFVSNHLLIAWRYPFSKGNQALVVLSRKLYLDTCESKEVEQLRERVSAQQLLQALQKLYYIFYEFGLDTRHSAQCKNRKKIKLEITKRIEEFQGESGASLCLRMNSWMQECARPGAKIYTATNPKIILDVDEIEDITALLHNVLEEGYVCSSNKAYGITCFFYRSLRCAASQRVRSEPEAKPAKPGIS